MLNIFKTLRRLPLHSQKLLFGFSDTSMQKLQSILKVIKDEQGKSILDSGSVVHHSIENNKVDVQLRLDKDYRRLKTLIKEQLLKSGFSDVNVRLAPKGTDTSENKDKRKLGLKNVKRVIAVSSCKGGVGKSTVAVNIACSLKELGLKVGIFDSDIYGPSLPTLLNKEGVTLTPREDNPKEIEPVDFDGLKCISFGFVANKSAVMRGPMVSNVVSQLLYQTYWGELDYLVVDMPPGTGDIQITLCQEINFDGAVIVTTPQRLAFVDVVKGIQLFQDMRVKILGVVENMAYHECVKCKHEDHVFGPGYLKMITDQFGIKNTVRIPLNSQISKFSDIGSPVVLTLPKQHNVVKAYLQITGKILQEADKPNIAPIVHYNAKTRKIVIETEQTRKQISAFTLRSKCKCALCIDEFTGRQILKKEEVKPDVEPVRIEEKGNYAVAVVWNDGHRSSIYPYQRLLSSEIEDTPSN